MKEAFGWRDLCGILCIAGGVVVVVLQVPEIQLSLTPTIIWYHVIRQQRVRSSGLGPAPRPSGACLAAPCSLPQAFLACLLLAAHPTVCS